VVLDSIPTQNPDGAPPRPKEGRGFRPEEPMTLNLPGLPCPPPFKAVVGATTCIARKRNGCRDCINCLVGDEKIAAEQLGPGPMLCTIGDCRLAADARTLIQSAIARGMTPMCRSHLQSWRQKNRRAQERS
jgi:hypothetical protein